MYEDIEAENERLKTLTHEQIDDEARQLRVIVKKTKEATILSILDGTFGPSAVNQWIGRGIARL